MSVLTFSKIQTNKYEDMFELRATITYVSKSGMKEIESLRIPNEIIDRFKEELKFRFPYENTVWLDLHKHDDNCKQGFLRFRDKSDLAQFLLWASNGLEYSDLNYYVK